MTLAFGAFILGILALHFESELPHWGFGLFIPVVLSVIWVRRDLLFPGFFMCGYLLALVHGHGIQSDRMPFSAGSIDCVLQGRIASLPDVNADRVRFEFEISRPTECGGYRVPSRVRIAWYDANVELRADEQWLLPVRLKPASGLMNPFAFDFEGWLFRHRIGAVGYVRSDGAAQRLETGSAASVASWRQALLDRIRTALSAHPQEGLVTALILGHQDHIDDAQWRILNATGTGHLIAISGMHIVLVAAAVAGISGWVWSWLPGGLLRLPRPQVAALAGMTAAIVYSALAGFSIPTQRAMIMVAVAAWIAFRRGELRPATALMLAGFAVLAWDTLAVFDAGFWLSFAAVAVIFYTVLGRLRRDRVFTWFGLQLAISVALIPLTVGFFQQASLISPVANFVAIPIIGMIVTPIALVGALLTLIVPSAGTVLLLFAADGIDLTWTILESMAQWPGASASFSALPVWVFVCAGVGIIWLLAPRGVPWRVLGLVWLMPLVFVQAERTPSGQATVALLDVGQGLAVVVETATHVLVYDTGPRMSEHFDAATASIIPYLRGRGIAAPDLVVVGHGDSDHRGGLPSLRRAGLLTAGLVSEHAARYFPEASYCQRGQQWEWDGVKFIVLHPEAGDQFSENNASCVIQVRAGNQSILLSGDIERGAEQALIKAWGTQLQSDVLIVPHHGSRTSSTPEFIDHVKPQVALVAAGFLNRYGFPKTDIVYRYRERGIALWSSADYGAITIQLGDREKEITPYGLRERGRYYWHRKAGAAGTHNF